MVSACQSNATMIMSRVVVIRHKESFSFGCEDNDMLVLLRWLGGVHARSSGRRAAVGRV